MKQNEMVSRSHVWAPRARCATCSRAQVRTCARGVCVYVWVRSRLRLRLAVPEEATSGGADTRHSQRSQPPRSGRRTDRRDATCTSATQRAPSTTHTRTQTGGEHHTGRHAHAHARTYSRGEVAVPVTCGTTIKIRALKRQQCSPTIVHTHTQMCAHIHT